MASSTTYFFNLYYWSMKGSVNRADISSSYCYPCSMLSCSLKIYAVPDHSFLRLAIQTCLWCICVCFHRPWRLSCRILNKPSAVPRASSTFLSLLQTEHFQGTGKKICSPYLFIFQELIDLPSPIFSAWKQEARRQIPHKINFPPKQLEKSKLFGCSFFFFF